MGFRFQKHAASKVMHIHRPMKQKWKRKKEAIFTKKPLKAVWIRIAAHSCLTTLKSLGGARTTVATAALYASVPLGESEPSEAALWFPLKPFHEDPKSPEEFLHSFHFLLFPLTLSYKIKRRKKKNIRLTKLKKVQLVSTVKIEALHGRLCLVFWGL